MPHHGTQRNPECPLLPPRSNHWPPNGYPGDHAPTCGDHRSCHGDSYGYLRWLHKRDRAWLRGGENLRKRYLVHVAGYNLGLIMRLLVGAGTPREFLARASAETPDKQGRVMVPATLIG